MLGFRHVMTAAYHPQSNGMVERLHRQLKAALRARNCGTSWAAHLPWVLLGIRAAPKDDANVSPAQVVYGAELTLPGQPAAGAAWDPPPPPAPGEAARSIPLRARSYAEAARGPIKQLQEATHVYIRRGGVVGPMALPYDGPYEVLQRGEKLFKFREIFILYFAK
jgi:transposase InsO family protein